ncbi:MAG: hypothetical protein ACO1QR_07180 [Chthoniobacteraceae bacterium]
MYKMLHMRAFAVFFSCLAGLFLLPASAAVIVYNGVARFEADAVLSSQIGLPKKSQVQFVVDFDTRNATIIYAYKQLGQKRYKATNLTQLERRSAQLADGRTASVLYRISTISVSELFNSEYISLRGANGSVILKTNPTSTTVRPRSIVFRRFETGSNATIAQFVEITATAALDSKATISANMAGQTFAQVVDTLKERLNARGYTEMP